MYTLLFVPVLRIQEGVSHINRMGVLIGKFWKTNEEVPRSCFVGMASIFYTLKKYVHVPIIKQHLIPGHIFLAQCPKRYIVQSILFMWDAPPSWEFDVISKWYPLVVKRSFFIPITWLLCCAMFWYGRLNWMLRFKKNLIVRAFHCTVLQAGEC